MLLFASWRSVVENLIPMLLLVEGHIKKEDWKEK
jgi:hypothetical protein